jgi:hypothetical protein
MRSTQEEQSVLITSVLHILDQREFEARVSPPAAAGDFRSSLPKAEAADPIATESRASGEQAIQASGLWRPALPEEPLFTTLPSQKAVEEFLRAMEEARAKGKARSIEIFE